MLSVCLHLCNTQMLYVCLHPYNTQVLYVCLHLYNTQVLSVSMHLHNTWFLPSGILFAQLIPESTKWTRRKNSIVEGRATRKSCHSFLKVAAAWGYVGDVQYTTVSTRCCNLAQRTVSAMHVLCRIFNSFATFKRPTYHAVVLYNYCTPR